MAELNFPERTSTTGPWKTGSNYFCSVVGLYAVLLNVKTHSVKCTDWGGYHGNMNPSMAALSIVALS